VVVVIDSASLLAAYDSQLRTDAETPGAVSVARQGPLRLVTFDGGRGFITYRDLDGAEADAISRMVGEALAHFQANSEITKVEWKTRGDSTEFSRPILERSGLVKVSTTTPYNWQR
jgi:hypothetical protein